MDISSKNQFTITGLSAINVLLGKNGCGKSTLLKKIEQHWHDAGRGEVNYVTPERGGHLRYEANVEQNDSNNPEWSKGVKRNNQWNQFKNYSVTQYRRLEILSLREIEKDMEVRKDLTFTFDSVIKRINNLLTNVQIVRTAKGDFELFTTAGEKIRPEQISSGESELISLAIECLTFEKSCDSSKQNFLLLDEPDVHLHPDLQANFILFLIDLVKLKKFSVTIATHSTAILGALLEYPDSRFAILGNGSNVVAFKPINEVYQNILPIFGAHPLSNLFNQNPILLVEGDDDVRIWQQAIRTANGLLKLYPCSVNGIDNMDGYEESVIEIINGVYDKAKAFSLRDKDNGTEDIADKPPIVRFKLSCRAAENLILSDEVLEGLDMTWPLLQNEIEKWLVTFTGHSKFAIMNDFKNSGFNRREYDLKELRNILIGLIGTSKPWEVAVGQIIAQLAKKELPIDLSSDKICNYLGKKLIGQLLS